MYRVVCDWPDCKASAQDDGEYYAWRQAYAAVDEAMDADWWRDSTNEKRHYCRNHPTTWTSDHEDGEPYPERPFLLVHDDDDSGYGGGTVTLIPQPSFDMFPDAAIEYLQGKR